MVCGQDSYFSQRLFLIISFFLCETFQNILEKNPWNFFMIFLTQFMVFFYRFRQKLTVKLTKPLSPTPSYNYPQFYAILPQLRVRVNVRKTYPTINYFAKNNKFFVEPWCSLCRYIELGWVRFTIYKNHKNVFKRYQTVLRVEYQTRLTGISIRLTTIAHSNISASIM